jgi:hypothetical protein
MGVTGSPCLYLVGGSGGAVLLLACFYCLVVTLRCTFGLVNIILPSVGVVAFFVMLGCSVAESP